MQGAVWLLLGSMPLSLVIWSQMPMMTHKQSVDGGAQHMDISLDRSDLLSNSSISREWSSSVRVPNVVSSGNGLVSNINPIAGIAGPGRGSSLNPIVGLSRDGSNVNRKSSGRNSTFNLAFLNVHGASYKMDEIADWLAAMDDGEHTIHMMCLAETWFSEEEALTGGVDDYEWSHQARADAGDGPIRGGLGELKHQSRSMSIIEFKPKHHHDDVRWYRMASTLVVVVYAPSTTDTTVLAEFYQMLSDNIHDAQVRFKDRELVLIGDFNARLGIEVGDSCENPAAVHLRDLVDRYQLQIANLNSTGKQKWTWYRGESRTIIDYALVSRASHRFVGFEIV